MHILNPVNIVVILHGCMYISSLSVMTKFKQISILEAPEVKMVEFANGVDSDEVAHCEPPHLNLHCLPFVL